MRRGRVLNSLDAGRRLALRTVLLQLAASALVGAVFLLLEGHRSAVSAAAGGFTVALGTALMSVQAFGRLVGGAGAFFRLLLGMLLKWAVVVGGLGLILFKYKLPPLAAVTGLVAAYAVYLVAFRFKG
jgi:ATP synthase protein I